MIVIIRTSTVSSANDYGRRDAIENRNRDGGVGRPRPTASRYGTS